MPSVSSELSLRIRAMRSSDIEDADRLRSQAGFNQTLEDWRLLLDLDPRGCFVGLLGDRVVGTVTTTSFSGDLAWIGMMIVSSQVRRQGIAKRLFGHAMRYLDDHAARHRVGLDATPMGRPLYDRFGFLPQYEITRWQGKIESAPGSAQDPTAREVSEGDVALVAASDQQIMRADRTRLLRGILTEPGAGGVLVGDPDEAAGWALWRPGASRWHVGPLVADGTASAARVLDAVSHRLRGEDVEIDLVHRRGVRGIAASHGLSPSRSFVRMLRCGSLPDNPRPVCYAVTGPETG